MRAFSALLAALLSATALAQTDCKWVEPKEKPVFAMDRNFGGELKFKSDPSWFRCAKKAGGELTATWEVASGTGDFESAGTEKLTSYSARETIGSDTMCKAGPGPKRVRVKLSGTGEMSKLNFESSEAAYYCARCQRNTSDNSLVVHISDRSSLTPKGMFTLQGNVHPEWFECAKAGSRLELRIFVGNSPQEVRDAKEPTHVVTGLEKTAKWKKAFDRKPICKTGASHMGYELYGTGEMSELNDNGRGVTEITAACKT